MSTITKMAKEEICRLENELKKIDAFLNKAPQGYLKWQNKNGRTYYAYEFEEKIEHCSKWTRKYITKKEISLAKALAQKYYYLRIRSIIEKNLKELRRFIKVYRQNEVEEIYDNLCDERKELTTPVSMSVQGKINQWKNESYEKNKKYPENLRYQTEQGDWVRSKSEVIIANMLYQNRNHILYKYERPLEVMENGQMKTIYPDFTIMNLHTGTVRYWEHAGRMDDTNYANEFVKKMNIYVTNGLLPGKDVFLSFESSGIGLDIGIVKQLIKELIN